MIYYLKVAAQHYKSLGKIEDSKVIDFLFEEMEKIINTYFNTGRFEVSDEIKNVHNALSQQIYQIAPSRIQELDNIIYNYDKYQKPGDGCCPLRLSAYRD